MAGQLADKRVSHLEDQPPRIQYVDWAGKPHTHTFDFRATLTDGTRYAVIVKPAEKADRPEARLVFSAIARDLPEKFAEAVVIVTERELSPAKVADARLVLNARDIVDEAADTKLLEVLGRLSGSVTIATLRDAIGLGGRGFGAIVRAIDKGLILVTGRERAPPSLARTRRDGRIDEASLVARA